MTIHQHRMRSVQLLAERSPETVPPAERWEKASKVMNAFYRYAALYYNYNVARNTAPAGPAYIQKIRNDQLHDMERKEHKARTKVQSMLSEYGLILEYPGLRPCIVEKAGGPDVIPTFWYD